MVRGYNCAIAVGFTGGDKMTKRIILTCGVALVLIGATSARSDQEHGRGQDRNRGPSAVYTMDNAAAGNNVWMMQRNANGSLMTPVPYPTGGTGTGGGLGNQGAVILSPEGRWLFACNAGSDEISVFSVTEQGLALSDKVASQGQRPISLTLHRNLLFVLNAGGVEGGSDNIAGFLFVCGRLLPMPGAMQSLSAANTDPAQIGFSRDGSHLVVTEKATAIIDTFNLGDCGEISSRQMFLSPDPPPFGFAVGKHDRLFVTQANGGGANPGASTVSSYMITDDGGLETLSDSVATHQTAACWVVLTPDERFAYTANTPNDSISSLVVRRDGELELLESQAALTEPGSAPIDMAFSRDGRFLYTLNSGNGTIGAYRRSSRGALHAINGAAGLPVGSNGLAAQ